MVRILISKLIIPDSHFFKIGNQELSFQNGNLESSVEK